MSQLEAVDSSCGGGGWGGGGSVTPRIKRTRVVIGSSEKKKPERYQDPVLWACFEIFHTQEGTILGQN